MYEYQRSSAGGQLSIVSPLILFRHTGTDSDTAQRARQARLGCAPAHRLFELVSVSRKETAVFPRSRFDYQAQVRLSDLPTAWKWDFSPAGRARHLGPPSGAGGLVRGCLTLFPPPRVRRVLKPDRGESPLSGCVSGPLP